MQIQKKTSRISGMVLGVVYWLAAGNALSQESTAPQLAAIQSSECGAAPYSILLTVDDVRKAEGTITADLHGDDPDKFLGKGQKLERIRTSAVEGQTLMCIPVEKAGVYAIALYHDEDGDTKFDKTWIGLPDEPFGLSNDPKIRLAKPKHEEVAFEVAGPLTPVTATLRH